MANDSLKKTILRNPSALRAFWAQDIRTGFMWLINSFQKCQGVLGGAP
jgi:hypothetical protein